MSGADEPARRTRSQDDEPAEPSLPRRAYLVRALAAERPTVAPSRWPLVDDVVLSGAARATADTLDCDDAWASTRHAAIRRSFGRWLVEDLGSRNGTWVNGARVARHPLVDRDVLETGHTAWVFRDVAADAVDAATVDLAGAFVTLHAPLETQLRRATAAVLAGLPVLVTGETGVGKERFAAEVHARARRPGSLIAVNCAALPAALVESELFGHRRGAFSGAVDERLGYVRAADRGTLLLDEIGDMPAAAQAALLRVLAERAVTPVGAERALPVDIAVISATHRALPGALRADLLARLQGETARLAPLRERREDIAIFVARSLARVAPAATLQVATLRHLLLADAPLNARGLEHAVAAAALRAGARPIAPDDLELPAPRPSPALSPEDAALRERLVAALADHAGNISAVARSLGHDRKQIHRWVARLAIPLDRGSSRS